MTVIFSEQLESVQLCYLVIAFKSSFQLLIFFFSHCFLNFLFMVFCKFTVMSSGFDLFLCILLAICPQLWDFMSFKASEKFLFMSPNFTFLFFYFISPCRNPGNSILDLHILSIMFLKLFHISSGLFLLYCILGNLSLSFNTWILYFPTF